MGAPQCTLCGRPLKLPRREGRRFELGVTAGASGRPANGRRLYLGARILVTGVNQHLVPLLGRSTNFLGEKVLVATPPYAGRKRVRYLFCLACGLSVLAKVSGESGSRYGWDWLAEMEPRGFANRWGSALRTVDPGVQHALRSILAQLSGLRPAGPSGQPPSIPALEAPNHAATGADNRSA